ncbi:hypothetical protein N7499_000558 [Penicillium canescens]|uniref:HMG box domain-containing protein n=1 Tax=Penicillium canescens TaxID=5083 RepID=A0AAD6NAW6_PENCN|nr:uncharacterized protein N7446_011240 [Penicillium canescens]KAJ6029410.1 hypothetical protein N7444_012397 [Penicillium canescens]KAJ6047841.1 hypothetical protein N7460_003988 [Penicillium canescens]KAJ6048557.1 hypothetical protein N7446_011240 [Penicillium canescens]KAJ6100928.1 hypothetical protein N7499_000558 [Penicillium canescens]KAJ6173385.1 hypothetical protein N7485_006197 [Penicillium canescens]
MNLMTPIPPSPPQSTDGSSLQEDFFEGRQVYPTVYRVMNMSPNEIDGNTAHGIPYGSPPSFIANSFPHTIPPQMMMMPGPQVNTPPTGADEAFMGLPTPPRRRAPAGKAKQQRRNRNRSTLSEPGLKIEEPISKLTKDYDVPIKDMDAWVARPAEIRRKEAKTKGRISRPMNSFMLYRSAYSERTKKLVGVTNHQVVSRIAGQGWKLEPYDIRKKYEDLAKLERDAHAATHPEYKFSPNKQGQSVVNRRDEGSPALQSHGLEEGFCSDFESEVGSTVSRMTPAPSYAHSRTQSFEESYFDSSRDPSPYGTPEYGMSMPNYVSPSWPNTSYPTGLPMQSNSFHGLSHMEHEHFCTTSPSLQKGIQYGSSLAGLPGASHHELLQPQSTPTCHHMDPQLLVYPNSSDATGLPNITGAAFGPGTSSYSTWDEDPTTGYFPGTSAAAMTANPAPYQNPHMAAACLPGMHNTDTQDPSWDLQCGHSGTGDAGPGEVDLWCPEAPAQNY